MSADLLKRKETHFVLWRVSKTPPELVIGQFQPGNPPILGGEQRFTLKQSSAFSDLWEIPATDCNLQTGQIYHYWFEVEDTDPERIPPARIRCTDPYACVTDWRLVSPKLSSPYKADEDQRASSVIKYDQGRLEPCDPGGEISNFTGEPNLDSLPPNNRLVIYELPTAWTRLLDESSLERGVGTFRDVIALIERNVDGANFSDLPVVQPGKSYLTDLGINALELLPPADSFYEREWGYGTSNFFAPDYELGFPEGNSSPTSLSDLTQLILTCHKYGIRFFVDMVTAFAKQGFYQCANFSEFHINPSSDQTDPDAFPSRLEYEEDGSRKLRNGWGGKLWRYSKFVDNAYDPISGTQQKLVPARQFMKAYLTHWMLNLHIDGIRLDTVENIANWDFIQEFKDLARQLWKQRWNEQSLGAGADERFLVVGEELWVPLELVRQQRLDGLWNENFKRLVRSAILGINASNEPSFEWTVRKAIDCRNLGFSDGSQSVIYLTSHDVEGDGNERLYNFLNRQGIWDTQKRIKLAFVCLLTAVGIPMILAGEEFADQHDRFDQDGKVTQGGGKQVDPVNFARHEESWRKEVSKYVSRLVKLRTSSDALAVNGTDFIHVDFNEGKRVLVWRRGRSDSAHPVVVVANFSDWGSNVQDPRAEYIVPNWPPTPPGGRWKEITRNEYISPEWVGREPIYPWEAKVYSLE
jgi:1,4-alpha-glucan branching enzyme